MIYIIIKYSIGRYATHNIVSISNISNSSTLLTSKEL